MLACTRNKINNRTNALLVLPIFLHVLEITLRSARMHLSHQVKLKTPTQFVISVCLKYKIEMTIHMFKESIVNRISFIVYTGKNARHVCFMSGTPNVFHM
jgi:hypothetical protein